MKLVCSAICRKVWVMVILASCFAVRVYAQDPHFSQFFASPVFTNPAFAGSSTVGRGVINYRSQWPGISGTFRTYAASYDEHYDIIGGGIAFMVMGDEAGVGTLRTLSFAGAYSYQINLTKSVSMRLAVQGAYNQKSIDFSKLSFYDMFAKGQGIVRPTQEVPPANPIYYTTVGAGGIVYGKNFYVGGAVHNINEPNIAFFGRTDNRDQPGMHLRMRYTGHAGAIIPLIRTRDEKKSSNLWPNILYMQQGAAGDMTSVEINLGTYYNRGPFVAGMFFRQNANYNPDAIIFLAGFRLPKMRFGFSYDHTISAASVGAGARQSYEVSLAFELNKRAHKKTFRNIRCPEF